MEVEKEQEGDHSYSRESALQRRGTPRSSSSEVPGSPFSQSDCVKRARLALTPSSPNLTPSRRDLTPVRQTLTSARQDFTPDRQVHTPARQKVMPARQEPTLARQDLTPARQDLTPTRQRGQPRSASSDVPGSPMSNNSTPHRWELSYDCSSYGKPSLNKIKIRPIVQMHF